VKVRINLPLSFIISIFILCLYLPTVQIALSNNIDLEPTRLDPDEVNKPFLIAYTPHDPIAIDGDGNFTDTALAEGWAGDGSSQNPYIIEGLEIKGPDSWACISIANTIMNFTIQDCNLTGSLVRDISLQCIIQQADQKHTFIQ